MSGEDGQEIFNKDLLRNIMIKRSYRLATLMLVASLTFAGCNKEELPVGSENVEQGGNNDDVKTGYFQVKFFPGIADGMTRAEVTGAQVAIQSLRYWIFRQQEDGKYTYYDPHVANPSFSEVVLKPETGGTIQSHEWPLVEGLKNGLLLPNGKYKVVFIGNYLPEQFEGQETAAELVTIGTDKSFESMRINMPDGGPAVFKEHNMFYLATADFDNVNTNPYIIMRRVVAKSLFTRDFIRTDDAVGKLVDSLVNQITEGNLSRDLLDGLLSTTITEPLKKVLQDLGLKVLLDSITTIVDRLVNALLGDLVTLLNKALLEYVGDLVNQLLLASVEDGKGEFSALNVLLNPWANVSTAEVNAYMPASIDMNRVPKSFKEYTNKLPVEGNVTEAPKTVTLTTLNGDFRLNSIIVDKEGIIGTALKSLDGKILDGLLINITTPLGYAQESNIYYKTTYDFLNLNLKADKNVTVDLGTIITDSGNDLTDFINPDRLVAAIVGDGVLSSLVGNLADEVVAPLINPLLKAVEELKITLPDIALGKISADGRWGATTNSVGVIIPTETGETGN